MSINGIEIKEAFSGKEYPTWIKNHRVFKKHSTVKKIFPSIGLANCEKEVEIDNSKEAKQFAEALRNALTIEITERAATIRTYSKREGLSNERLDSYTYMAHLLDSVKRSLAVKGTLNSDAGKLSFNLTTDILNNKKEVVFKKGERVFSVYGKLNELLTKHNFLTMENLDNLDAFREFSAHNMPTLKYKLVFSSMGVDGIWDIATMSMRGVSSCQTWGIGQSTGLIGSIIDPFTGILYMTSGSAFNEHGSKMVRRSVVRYCLNAQKKPLLIVERMYPQMEQEALKNFIAFLKERVDKSIEVIYYPNNRRQGLFVPKSKAITSLPIGEIPYRDSGVEYREEKTKENSISWKVCDNIASKVMTSVREMKKDQIDEQSIKSVENFLNPINVNGFVKLHETASSIISGVGDYKSFLEETIKEPNKILVPCMKSLNNGLTKNKFSNGTLDSMVRASSDRISKYLQTELDKVNKTKASKEELYNQFLN